MEAKTERARRGDNLASFALRGTACSIPFAPFALAKNRRTAVLGHQLAWVCAAHV